MKYGKAKRYRPNTRKSIRRKVKRMAPQKRNFMKPSWFPFGRSRTCKLRYCETISINPSIGATGTYTFSANGMYDPNISGTGHQPYGFDQLCALYNHYYVTGSRIKVTAVNTSLSSFVVGVKLCDATTLNSATPDYVMEQPGFRKRIIANNASAVSPGVACNFSAKKFWRLKNKSFILADDTLSGSASGNPAEQAYFVVVFQPAIVNTDLPDTTFQIQIDYIATFTGPKELTAS